MKILVGIWSIRVGGAETFALNLCKYLNDNGHTCYLFPVKGPWDYKFYRWIEKSGVRILTPFKVGFLDWFGWKINALFLIIFKKCFRNFLTKLYYQFILKRYSFDCIISNSLLFDLFITEQETSKTPIILIEHGDYSMKIIDNGSVSLKSMKNAKKIVCVSNWCKENLYSVINASNTNPSNIEVIYNGHLRNPIKNLVKQGSQLEKSFVFGMIGRSVETKGWEEAIQAFLVIQKRFPTSKLLLIGDGEYIQQLKENFNNSNIVFAGRQNEPQHWIQYVDVGLMLSQKYEAFGIALLDFFSLGKPVIATTIGGIPEVVCMKDKCGGILVPVNELGKAKVNKVVEAMERMILDESFRKVSALHAEQIYQEFPFETTGKKYLTLIEQLVEGR